LRVALQCVVNRLRRGEELVCAANDAPLDLEPRVLHQWNERVLDLGDAASERGRRELEDARAGERRGQCANLVHQAAARDGRVVRERLVPDVDKLQHFRANDRTEVGWPGPTNAWRSGVATRACPVPTESRTRLRSCG